MLPQLESALELFSSHGEEDVYSELTAIYRGEEKSNDLKQSAGSVHTFYVWVGIFLKCIFSLVQLKCGVIAQLPMCCEL